MNIPNILIIDDDPSLRKTLADVLRLEGYEVNSAQDGTEGLSLLRQCRANIVLIDLGLPDMPGTELIKKADEALYRAKETGRNRVEFLNG